MGVPAYLQPDLEADLVLPPTPAGRVNNQWMVQVEPKFHDDASNLEQLVPFEECIELHSSGKEFVTAPEYLLLTHNGRSFNIVVDPTNLSDGLHYYELCGIDCKAPWRGPVFRIPVTITKAMAVKNRPALLSFSGMSFLPDQSVAKAYEVGRCHYILVSFCQKLCVSGGGWSDNGIGNSSILVKWHWKS